MVEPGLRRSSDCAMTKVVLTIVSRGITIRQNSTTRLTSTIMLNGFFTTFKIRFLSRFFVKGFLGRSFFDTVTPLSDYCRESRRGNFLFPSHPFSRIFAQDALIRGARSCKRLRFANLIILLLKTVCQLICSPVHRGFFMDFNNCQLIFTGFLQPFS